MSQLKIREMPQDERPREKLAAHGAAILTDPELIAILLRTGIPGTNAIEVARKLLKDYGSLSGLSRCTVDRQDNSVSFAICSAMNPLVDTVLTHRVGVRPWSGRRFYPVR